MISRGAHSVVNGLYNSMAILFRAIKVLFGNVQDRYKYAFNIERGQSDFGIPYDYCSIMQVN